MKYTYTEDMAEISGLGGAYEQACRRMTLAGLAWAEHNNWQFSGDAVGLHEAIVAEEPDCTDAMLGACSMHVMRILRVGWDVYVEDMIQAKRKKRGV